MWPRLCDANVEQPQNDTATAAYEWSVGRVGQFRVGWYGGTVDGLRLSLWDGTTERTFDVAGLPLYTGRWVHLAATYEKGVGTQDTWVRVYLNGNVVRSWHPPPFNVGKDGSEAFRVGRAGAGGYFRGLVDEVKVYSSALAPDGVKGLVWLTGGSNNLLIPRGVFYSSLLYSKFNGTYEAGSPFDGAVVNGNSNNLSSNLNSRVIQLVITKNATLAQAWGILDLARTNSTGNVTAFPFFATSEFYTLGLSWEVSKLTANASARNSGNSSLPPPLGSWRLFWNTIAGLWEYVWDATGAVRAFFASVGKWLADFAVGLFVGLATGNWTYFQDNVVEPFFDAISKFIQWVVDFVNAILQAATQLFRPLLDRIAQWRIRVLGSYALEVDGANSPQRASGVSGSTANLIIGGDGFTIAASIAGLLSGLATTLGLIVIITAGLTYVVLKWIGEYVYNLAKAVARATVNNIGAILFASMAALLTTVFIGFVDYYWPGSSEALSSLTPWLSVAVAIGGLVYMALKGNPLVKVLVSDPVGLAISILGLFLGGVLGLLLTIIGFWWTWASDDFIDQLPLPKAATMIEEIVTVVDMGATLYQFIEDNS